MIRDPERLGAGKTLALASALIASALLCVCMGSVNVPLPETLRILLSALRGLPAKEGAAATIILRVRLPRVLCAGLTGAALSLGGAAMQGLLRNPLADGSTLGVSSGASLGAVLSLAFGVTLPGLPGAGTAAMAMLFAFLSLALILSLALAADRSLSTHGIILVGVVFSMFVSSLISLAVAFSGERLRSVAFWTMGSFSGASMESALLLGVCLFVFGWAILRRARELNAFAVGEENARHIGVDVRRVKLVILAASSALIGVCVSVAGTIGFVGLVAPHAVRLLVGPNHKRLLPASMLLGATFLLLCDLAARTLLSPAELPIGVVTSLIGAAAFGCLLVRDGRRRRGC